MASTGRMNHMVFGHWEDLFVSQGAPLRPVVTLNSEEYLKRLKRATGVNAIVPAPQVMMRCSALKRTDRFLQRPPTPPSSRYRAGKLVASVDQSTGPGIDRR